LKKCNIINIATIISFFLIIVLPVAFFNFKPNQISKIDNKMLEEFPDFNSGYNDFIAQLKKYFANRIGFREQLIKGNILLKYNVFGKLYNPTYESGEDGYIFFKTSFQKTDFDYIDDFASFVKRAEDYCTQREVPFLYSLEPIKQLVYTQHIASGINYKNDRVDYLLKRLDEEGVNYIYTAPKLIEASKTEQVFDIQYDAGHWNDNGAFIGISEALNYFKDVFKDLKVLQKSDYTIENVLRTGLPVSYFPINEYVPNYIINNPEAEAIKKYSSELKRNETSRHYEYFVNENNKDAPKLLVFCGSYYNTNDRSKFLRESFSELIFVHNYENVLNLDYYFNIFKPDAVLFESTDYATESDYFSHENVKKASYNPAYAVFKQLSKNDGAKVEKEVQNCTGELTELSYTIKEAAAYAYLDVDGNIYDFKINGNIISIVMDTELLKTHSKGKILLISKDLKTQQEIKIDF